MKCTVDNTSYALVVPISSHKNDGCVSAWGTYHFVKHCIMESYHALYRICSVSEEMMKEYRMLLHGKLQCHLFSRNPFTVSQFFCSQCPSLRACSCQLRDGITAYIATLLNVVRVDHKKPRHVYYDTQREKDNIAFVSDDGIIVITQRQKSRLVIKSGYRHSGVARIAQRSMTNQHYLLEAKKKFQDDVIRGKLIRARFVHQEYWT